MTQELYPTAANRRGARPLIPAQSRVRGRSVDRLVWGGQDGSPAASVLLLIFALPLLVMWLALKGFELITRR